MVGSGLSLHSDLMCCSVPFEKVIAVPKLPQTQTLENDTDSDDDVVR
jgi:hypothetical protein